ncbi:MAG TPA: hypothetical protein VGE76_16120 [Opitutaceae bacterium]
MDDELQQLEAELKSLRPAPLPATLVARVEVDLAEPPVTMPARPRGGNVAWFWPFLTAAAAALAMTFAPRPPVTAEGKASIADGGATLKPIAAENLLVSAQDEGLVTLPDGTPARRARLQYVDTITFKNPRTNASLTWSVPREEVRIVPVSFQ